MAIRILSKRIYRSTGPRSPHPPHTQKWPDLASWMSSSCCNSLYILCSAAIFFFHLHRHCYLTQLNNNNKQKSNINKSTTTNPYHIITVIGTHCMSGYFP